MDSVYRTYCSQQRQIYQPKIPRYYTTAGDIYEGPINGAHYDISGTFRSRLDTSWVPKRTSRPDPPLLMKTSEIYNRAIGQLPGYGGHVPGDTTRFGSCYGVGTRDAKRYIRGD